VFDNDGVWSTGIFLVLLFLFGGHVIQSGLKGGLPHPSTRYLKKDITPKRVELEKRLYQTIKKFQAKLKIKVDKRSHQVWLVYPEGIWSRDFEAAEESIQWFADFSNICKEIASIKQDLKLLYLQEDIAKE